MAWRIVRYKPLSFPLGCRVDTVTTTFPLPCRMNSLELLTQLRSHIGWEVRKMGRLVLAACSHKLRNVLLIY